MKLSIDIFNPKLITNNELAKLLIFFNKTIPSCFSNYQIEEYIHEDFKNWYFVIVYDDDIDIDIDGNCNTEVGCLFFDKTGYIDTVCVQKKYRKKGVGKLLLKTVICAIKKIFPAKEPNLIVDPNVINNKELVIFYQSFGFVVTKKTSTDIYMKLKKNK